MYDIETKMSVLGYWQQSNNTHSIGKNKEPSSTMSDDGTDGEYTDIVKKLHKMSAEEIKELHRIISTTVRQTIEMYIEAKNTDSNVDDSPSEHSELSKPKNSVAQTILQKIGGINILQNEVGANTFFPSADGISFKFQGKEANYAKITLDSKKDLYSIDYKKISDDGVKNVATFKDIDFNTIQDSIFNGIGSLKQL